MENLLERFLYWLDKQSMRVIAGWLVLLVLNGYLFMQIGSSSDGVFRWYDFIFGVFATCGLYWMGLKAGRDQERKNEH